MINNKRIFKLYHTVETVLSEQCKGPEHEEGKRFCNLLIERAELGLQSVGLSEVLFTT